MGAQYRSGIYYYNETQAWLAQESKEAKQLEFKDQKIVIEILPAKRFYRAKEYHQQYLEKGGGKGVKQSAEKGCTDPIRCYGWWRRRCKRDDDDEHSVRIITLAGTNNGAILRSELDEKSSQPDLADEPKALSTYVNNSCYKAGFWWGYVSLQEMPRHQQ